MFKQLKGPYDDPPRILIAEDDRGLADLYTMWLEEDYFVQTAYNGEDALTLLDPRIDVVVLDRRMPGLSGDDVLGHIRERPGNYQVVMVTAVVPDSDLLKLDCDEYITKPVSKDDLKTVIEELLERKALDQNVQDYLALASKKQVLEAELPPKALRNSRYYEILLDELNERRNQLDTQLTSLSQRKNSTLNYPLKHLTLGSLLILVIVGLLLGIHIGFPTIDDRGFIGNPLQSFLYSTYVASFIHTSDSHLYGNLGAFLVVATVAFVFCLRLLVPEWFYLTTVFILIILPVITRGISYGILEVFYPTLDPVLTGFSHIVSGFVGFSLLAFLFLLRTVYDHRSIFLVGLFILVGSLTTVFWINQHNLLEVSIIGSFIVFLGLLVARGKVMSVKQVKLGSELQRLGVVSAISIGYAWIGLGLFPTLEVVNPQNVAILSHGLGLFVGSGIAFVTAFLTKVFPIEDRIRQKGYPLQTRFF